MRIKKQLAAVLLIVITLIAFAACSEVPSNENLIANGNFVLSRDGGIEKDYIAFERWVRDADNKYVSETAALAKRCLAPTYANNKYNLPKWSKTFPEGWKIDTSDPAIASFAGFEYGAESDEMNAVTLIVDSYASKTGGVTPTGCGWVRLYQKVRVNPGTNYKITFEYTGRISKPHSSLQDKANNAVGIVVGFLEDPSYIPKGAINSSGNGDGYSRVSQSSASYESFSSPIFNSGSLRHLTVCISLGAQGHDIGDSNVNIRKISMAEEITEVTAAHTVYRNGGYKDTIAAAVVFTVIAFIFLAAICFIVIHYVNKNYVYSKAKDEDGIKAKGSPPRGKTGKKADLSADEGDFLEVPVPEDGEEAAGKAVNAGKISKAYEKVKAAAKTAWAKQPFLVLIGLAFVLRLACVFLFRGYRPDVSAAASAIDRIFADGVKYYSLNGVNYAPGQLYIFYYLGLFKNWFNLAAGGAGMAFFSGLPVLAADLGIGYTIYSFTKKFVNKKTALGISALYLFNPAVLFAFSIWRADQAVWLFFLILALRYMLDRKYLQMCAAYAGAVLFSESALAVAPLLAVFLIVVFVKAFSAYWRWTVTEKKPSDGLLAMPKYSAVWKAPAAILLFFVALFLMCLPLTASGIESGESFTLFSYFAVFQKLAISFAFNTNNGFNVAAFMGRNGTAFGDVSGTAVIAVYFIMCMILAAVYVMKRNRANLLLLSSFLYLFTAYFMANADPLTAVPGLVILLLACAAVGDRRLYGHYVIFSVICLLNISAVMISAQYMNSLPDYLLDTATNPAYSGFALLPKWFMIAGSVIALSGFLYYLYIVMDITVANRRKVFMPFDRENPHYALDTFKSIFW